MGTFVDFTHEGVEYTSSVIFHPDEWATPATLTHTNLISGAREVITWVTEMRNQQSPILDDAWAALFTSTGGYVGFIDFFFHRKEHYHQELRMFSVDEMREIQLNGTTAFTTMGTSTTKSMATHNPTKPSKVAKSTTGGFPKLVYRPDYKPSSEGITLSRKSGNNTQAMQPYSVSGNAYHFRTMTKCRGVDTLLSGPRLRRGGDLWSTMGARLYVQDDGNLCLWHYPKGTPTLYWCWDHGVKFSKDVSVRVENNGLLCFWDPALSGPFCSNNTPGTADGHYRLTLQNDGNLVMYRGVFDQVMFDTATNIFPYVGPNPCTRTPYY
ncbi:hypothetical protein BGZ76_000567 [Entomortierella beljakovae]|nr:hypothetical protein BGZ76_000567 [Entomortierella beljakovae]